MKEIQMYIFSNYWFWSALLINHHNWWIFPGQDSFNAPSQNNSQNLLADTNTRPVLWSFIVTSLIFVLFIFPPEHSQTVIYIIHPSGKDDNNTEINNVTPCCKYNGCPLWEGGGKYDVGYVAGDLAPLQRPHNPHHRACEVSSHHNEQ